MSFISFWRIKASFFVLSVFTIQSLGLAGITEVFGRSKVLNIEPIADLSSETCQNVYKINSPIHPATYTIKRYRITYQTVDFHGKLTKASGLLAFNPAIKQQVIASYQHGTSIAAERVPSSGGILPEGEVATCLYAGSIYVLAAADYLGLGVSELVHPYLDIKTEATATRDMIGASRKALGTIGHVAPRGIVLTGYSQGGPATMALLKDIERFPILGTKVLAAAPMAGAYDLGEPTLAFLDNPRPYFANMLMVYTLYSMNHYHSLFEDVTTKIKDPHKGLIRLFQLKDETTINKLLPEFPEELFTAEFLNEIRYDETSKIRQVLAANNIFGFKTKVKIAYIYAGGDDTVLPENSKIAHASMIEFGSDAKLINVGDQYDHKTGFGPAQQAAFRFISETLAEYAEKK
ncbi:MAG: hypothetical protein KBD78_12700 [Oligoflexales bacterium]|nr:hypothetical protein [Oligoflexales bacterium]